VTAQTRQAQQQCAPKVRGSAIVSFFCQTRLSFFSSVQGVQGVQSVQGVQGVQSVQGVQGVQGVRMF